MLRAILSAAVCVLALIPLADLGRAVAADEPPNVIFIMADDLGYGDLGCYGQKIIQTPNLDRMAQEGMRFTDFYAGSTVCAPSRCVLITGYHTGRAFIRGNGKDNLRPEDVTVAEVLKGAGYTTGLVGKWGLGHEGSTGVPTRQGFDYFFGYLDQHHAHNYYPTFLMRNEQRAPLKNVVPGEGDWGQGVATEKVEYSHDLVAEEALTFIDRNRDKRFFLYLALTIPHANNEARDKGMEVPDYGQYADRDWPEPQKGHAAMISRMDRDIGRLLERLKQHGIDEKTLVFFTSDNGPHAEGGNDPDFADSNGPLRGIKRSLHDGGIRVPMIARWPGKIDAGAETDFVSAFEDVMPTLADLAGAADAAPSGIDGLSFLPTLLGRGEQKQHDHLYWAFYERGGGQAIRQGRWKAVQQPIHTPVRLYNLEKDLGEENDIAAEHPDLVAQLKTKMADAYEPSDRWTFPAPPAKKEGRRANADPR
jgi:arylsulfatase A-like enzyme